MSDGVAGRPAAGAPNARHAQGLNLDVATARRREQALRLQKAVIDHMAEGVVLCNTAGVIVFANPSYEAMLGYEAGELVGQHGAIVNSPAEADPVETANRIVAELQRSGHWSGTVRNRRKDGRDIWVRVSICTFEHEEQGRLWVNVCADISESHALELERDRANAEVHRLAESLQRAVETERAELARELHDQLGAALTGLRMRLEALASPAAGLAPKARKEALELARQAQAASMQTRELCSRLRPPVLDDLGIVETCRWYMGAWPATPACA